MEPQWTPRMQEVCEIICRYALETGELPTIAEISRRLGLSRERTRQIWVHVERYENRKLDPLVHIKRAHAGYLLAVLKDIEKAARKAGRGWPWRKNPKPPPQPRVPRPNPPIPQYPWFQPSRNSWEYYDSQRPDVGDLIDCEACFGTARKGDDWCPVCEGEGTIVYGKPKK